MGKVSLFKIDYIDNLYYKLGVSNRLNNTILILESIYSRLNVVY